MNQQYYYMKDIEKITGRSYKTIWRWVKEHRFPAYKRMFPYSGNSKIYWDANQVNSWIRGIKIRYE